MSGGNKSLLLSIMRVAFDFLGKLILAAFIYLFTGALLIYAMLRWLFGIR